MNVTSLRGYVTRDVSSRDPDGEMAVLTAGAGERALVRRRGMRRRRMNLRMSSVFPRVLYGAGSSQRFGMVAAGAGVTQLLVLLLMVAAAPSRARGSGCRVGAAARGVSASGPGGAASCGC